MARIALVEPQNAPSEVKQLYDSVFKGKPGNVQKAMALRPEILKTFLPFYSSVGRGLDHKLYEMIYIRVSMVNHCNYCLQHHLGSSKRAGLTAEDWKALQQPASSNLPEKEKTLLSYVEKLTRRPSEIKGKEVEALKKWFSDPEIVEIHILVGLVNLTNRFTDVLGLEVEFPAEKIA